MTTINYLKKLAKEAKVKNRSTLNKSQLCLVLGIKPSPPNEKYEKYCRGNKNIAVKITLVNKKTGEKKKVLQVSKKLQKQLEKILVLYHID